MFSAAVCKIQASKGYAESVTFNLDPPKIGSPWNEFSEIFGPTLKKFVPTEDQPHKRKSVTTKDVSGVHSCISRQMNDWFS